MTFVFTLTFISGSLMMYAIDYITMKPVYLCENERECDYTEFCDTIKKVPIKNFTIDWSSPLSLDNWITNLDLHCN